MIRSIQFLLICLCFFSTSCSRRNMEKNKKADGPIIPTALPVFKQVFSPEDTLLSNTDTLLFYRRSACFGFCPTFDFTIYQNGIVKYDGIQHVDNLGTAYRLASDSWWNLVKAELNKFDFYKLASVYPIEKELYIPDLPNTIITLKEMGMRKSVIDNHHAPKELKDFEIFIEAHFQELFNHR